MPASTSTQPAPAAPCATRFLGRQPIFDRARQVLGYELLFRSSLDNWADRTSDSISLQVLDDTLMLGLDTVLPAGKAFVNCNRQALVELAVTLLPAESAVVEILEDVAPDDEVLRACTQLKNLGYQIALDDFLPGRGADAFLPFADFIKLDLRASSPQRLSEVVRLLRNDRVSLLAEKVETEQEFSLALGLGFDSFQGYFFARPTILQGNVVPANQLLYIQLLGAVTSSPIDSDEIERLVMAEPSFCVRVLRLVNSAAFALRGHVTSIRQALLLLGEDQIRRLVTVAAATCLGQSASSCTQLVLLGLERARFCELLAQRSAQLQGEQYLIGLLSSIDAILQVPMQTLLRMLPLRSHASAALLGDPNPTAAPLRLAQAFERSDGGLCAELCSGLRVTESEAATAHVEALQWASRQFAGAL